MQEVVCVLFQTDFFAGKWPASETNLTNWYVGLDYLENRLCKQKWLSSDKVINVKRFS